MKISVKSIIRKGNEDIFQHDLSGIGILYSNIKKVGVIL